MHMPSNIAVGIGDRCDSRVIGCHNPITVIEYRFHLLETEYRTSLGSCGLKENPTLN